MVSQLGVIVEEINRNASRSELTLVSPNRDMLLPPGAAKDHLHRLSVFCAWLDALGYPWHDPHLAAYRDHLSVRGLSPASIAAHLGTIRSRYKALLRDNGLRDVLYSLTPPGAALADRKAFVDEMLSRLLNSVDPSTAPVKVTKRQDRPQEEHLRLSASQASALLAAPGTDSLIGLRDTCVIAFLLCTGLREAELCALDVSDLRVHLGEALALHVREGKGAKARLIPYGDLDFVLAIASAWGRSSGIQEGALLRGFYKGERVLRENRLTVRAVQDILGKYPISIEGELRVARPHDLRRTYARRLYEAGMDLVAIQQNLGHSDTKTTLLYIGDLHADLRRPPAVYSFDLSALAVARRL